MPTLKFKCTLLSDLILNQKSASQGPNETLDFIPGACFLGIVAKDYARFQEKGIANDLFHNGKVKFGDAHPALQTQQGTWLRALRMPAALFYPKMASIEEKAYVHHAIPNFQDPDLRKDQPKQCRGGFYAFEQQQALRVSTQTQFAIKSAYDAERRCAKDEQMFGYESLEKGLQLLFSVTAETPELAEMVEKALCGKDHRVGRSRSAQYGRVKIERCDYPEPQYSVSTLQLPHEGKTISAVAVYMESRCCFFDQYDLLTTRPSAQQLGFGEGARIVWEKSQVRTFQYAPWNAKRQSFDADRQGIEKGSVLIVETQEGKSGAAVVGSFQSEGFGRIIYNPDFLSFKEKGKSALSFGKADTSSPKAIDTSAITTPLLRRLRAAKAMEAEEFTVYQTVNDWVKTHHDKFSGKTFASQWGNIRTLAIQSKTSGELESKLYDKDHPENGYLTHGVAKEKWEQHERLKALKNFAQELHRKDIKEGAFTKAFVNLAAEMAKQCSN